jgi:hypothetical protein
METGLQVMHVMFAVWIPTSQCPNVLAVNFQPSCQDHLGLCRCEVWWRCATSSSLVVMRRTGAARVGSAAADQPVHACSG